MINYGAQIFALLILLACGSFANTLSEVLAFRQILKQAPTEEQQVQETTKLADLLLRVRPRTLTAGLSKHSLDSSLAALFELKQIVRISSDETGPELIKLKKLNLTRIRYLEDYLFERKFNSLRKTHSGFDTSLISDGDIILLRGGSSVSATVAAIGETPMVYSHLGIVYVEPETGRKFFVESLPKLGVVSTPLELIDSSPHSRISIYRSKKPQEAKVASEMAYQMAIFSRNNGSPFDFDFSMDPAINLPFEKNFRNGKVTYTFDITERKNCLFFCSKLLSYVISGSGESSEIPRYKSRFRDSVRPILGAVGVPPNIKETFLPGDFELEGGFDLVHEYRNPTMTFNSRIDDFIIHEVLNKIAFERKLLKSTNIQKTAANLIHTFTSAKTTNRLMKAIGVPMSTEISAELMITLYNLERILSITKKELFKNYTAKGIDLAGMSIAETKQIVQKEFNTNVKLFKFFVEQPSNAASMCLRFYRPVK